VLWPVLHDRLSSDGCDPSGRPENETSGMAFDKREKPNRTQRFQETRICLIQRRERSAIFTCRMGSEVEHQVSARGPASSVKQAHGAQFKVGASGALTLAP